jgi:glycosyltransferase involved in cell wall biosynthesis
VDRVSAQTTEDLVAAYGSAWATVVPSVEEAFGLVVLESLAAGTPVVGARSGAIPELLTAPEQGLTFEPDDAESLAEAMAAALELGFATDAVAVRRARAGEFAWSGIAATVEGIYERLIDSPGP